MLTTEHILLESDVREIPQPRAARKTHASLRLHSALRRRAVALDIIDYYYLSVRTSRPGAGAAEYVLDLRFVDPEPELTTHIAWRWMTVTIGLAVLLAACIGWIGASPQPWWKHGWLGTCGILLAMAVLAGVVCAYRTTETLRLYSVHGRAQVLEFTGGLGTFGKIRRFTAKLAAHVQIAVAARRPSRAEHLRDEMREHHRLREVGVVSDEQYEESKRRILQQHGGKAS
ncbi:MAG TPA: hypothetical protein VJ011_10235 [Steroidobacteraceae bacterium]|nr:hypothetical protein [Steroidobacteraceae bacterium]